MKINKVSVNNVGIYCGRHVFDFSQATKERPIILFGGLNGAGKTTLFDGIRLCLYGRDIFKRITEKSYFNYLKGKTHHTDSMLLPPNGAFVCVDFEYADSGEVNNFRVERSWAIVDECVNETLSLYKNDIPFDEISSSSWQDFINEMIPIGVSQLFFFDGEKIKNIIADNTNNEFVNSVKALLGIDIIERLQADIKIYQTRDLRKLSSEKEKQLLDDLDAELAKVEYSISQIKDKMASIENNIQRTQDDLKNYKSKFAAEGGAFFSQREKLREQKNSQDHELEQLREQLRDFAAGVLPVLIARKLAIKLKAQLQSEEKQYVENTISEKIRKQKKRFIETINSPEKGLFNVLSLGDRNNLITLVNSCFGDATDKPKIKELFGYSPSQTSALISIVDVLDRTEKRLKQLVNDYEDSFRKRQKIERDLAKVPAEELIKTMYNCLADLSQKLGNYISDKARFEEQLIELDRKKATITIEYGHIYQRIGESEKNDQKFELTMKVDKVLDIFKKRLAQSRVERLQHEFLKIFNSLHRKNDIVNRVVINPETLSILLLDKKNKEILVDKLSSGEKEIYAIALLCSLAKTSSMNLPFIIDTPLGRLDNEHRHNLVNLFFPHISHQMIIFSTDTEIGEEYYNMLKPYIACEYNLGYDDASKNTQAKQGYFWS